MTASLRADTAVYGAAIAIDRLLALLLLPLLTRAIGAADYGAWTQTLAAAGLLMPVVLFGLPTAVVRSFSGAGAARWRFFVRLGGLLAALALACALALQLLADPLAGAVWGDAGRRSLVPALAAIVAADAAVEFAFAWLRAAGRIGLIAGLLLARSVLRYAVLWALVGADGGIAGWLPGYALAQGLLAAGALAITAALLRAPAQAAPGPDAPTLGPLLAFAAPLVGLALFTALNATLDRFVLVQLLGLDAVAVYAAAASLSGVPAVFYSVLGFTLFPALAAQWSMGRRDEAARLTSLALQVFGFLCLPVALAIGLTGPWLLQALTTADYRAPMPVFLLLGAAVAAFGLYQILLYALLLAGRSRQVLALAAIAAAANAGLNLVLAPQFGMAGAAAAAAVSNTAMVVVASRLARQVMDWRFPWAGLWPLAWRAGVAAAPLAVLMAGAPQDPAAAWPAAAAGLVAGSALYLALDLLRPASLARRLLAR